jgi:hypothetical protein
MGLKSRIFDYAAAAAMLGVAPFASLVARRRDHLPVTRSVLDRFGVSCIAHHYYEPVVLPEHITRDLTAERTLPGIDLNAEEQLAILRAFDFASELKDIANQPKSDSAYSFQQPFFGPGDAEYLYSMVRRFKPKRIIEVGCGHSTRMIRHAVDRNRAAEPGYACEHICIEPYENPWLESLGASVIRQRVEDVDLAVFQTLGRNDILFIDSSHVIKPQGDVVFLYLTVVPLLRSGVFVHAHDILTPRDYFPEWVLGERRMWDEQYLLEAFLSFNSAFKITGALNWLWHNHRQETHRAFPVLATVPDDDPGSFWFQRT